MKIFTVWFQSLFKIMVDSALDKIPNFYVGTGYLCRSNRRSGLDARIAEKPLISAVEEVKLESYSGFFSP